MLKRRHEVRNLEKKLRTKLKEILKQVCSQGYVKYEGKWYRGYSPKGKKPQCNLCDFAGCLVEDTF